MPREDSAVIWWDELRIIIFEADAQVGRRLDGTREAGSPLSTLYGR